MLGVLKIQGGSMERFKQFYRQSYKERVEKINDFLLQKESPNLSDEIADQMIENFVYKYPLPLGNDQLVTRFVNNLMWDGKKSVAFKVFYDAIDIVEQKKNNEEKTALEVWKDALTNVMPHVEVRSRRVGGATFQIPMQIRPDRKVSMAMKWLIGYARKRNEKSMAQKLAGEILSAAKEEGAAVKKRMDTHKMAEANKAFSHFRF